MVTGGKEMGENIYLHPIYLSGFVLININGKVRIKYGGRAITLAVILISTLRGHVPR